VRSISALQKCIQDQSRREEFSGVVFVTQGDKVLFAESYGQANRAESVPNEINTKFQIASGCKIFTSVAICQLVEKGLLDFDTPLKNCVDVHFPNYHSDICVKHLLTHTSGITSYFEEDVDDDYEALWKNVPMYRIREPRDFLPLFKDKRMKFLPGQKFDYNDAGYILLGLIVESLGGMSFSKYVEENVFAPAGMKDSGYFRTDQLPAGTAFSYINEPKTDSWRTNFFAVPIKGAPDGGAYTTAPDTHSFWKALFKYGLVNRHLTDSLLQSQVSTGRKSPYTDYGYGLWINREDNATKKYFVEGLDPGVAFRSAVYPNKELTLTMIGNTERPLWPLFARVEKVLQPEVLPPT